MSLVNNRTDILTKSVNISSLNKTTMHPFLSVLGYITLRGVNCSELLSENDVQTRDSFYKMNFSTFLKIELITNMTVDVL